jgi:5'-3' exonuclease
MAQPIPRKIQENNPDYKAKRFNTLLVDGSNILELSTSADRRVNSEGKVYGGTMQFLLQLKLMMRKGNFRYVYVFWDGPNSGEYRAMLLPTYKSNRDKDYDLSVSGELSDYMKEVNARVKSMQEYFYSKNKAKLTERRKEKELFYDQREVVMQCLEEVCVRQCVCDKVEADDLIAYYVNHKKSEERIVIMSNDRDLTQLISEDVIIYVQNQKKFINTKNHTTEMGYNYQNVLLKKIICGDASDSIKGIKGVGEKTLLDKFPEVKERKVGLSEIIEKAKQINEQRISDKKKPLKWAENIVNRVTDGVQGEKIYEINKKVIDLKHPILTDEAKELMDTMMYAPIDGEGRSLSNLYRILVDENGIDEFRDENRFSSFFYEYKVLMNREINGI